MTALLLGCGSKWGLTVQQQLLAKDWTVYSLSSTEQTEQDNLHQELLPP